MLLETKKKRKCCSFAPLEEIWTNAMGRYCRFVAIHPWPFIILPTIITTFLATGFLQNFEIVRGVHWLYSPLNAPWKNEEAILQKNWAGDDVHFYPGKDVLRRKGIYLLVESLDEGSVLRPREAADMLILMDFVTNSTFSSKNGSFFSYRDICLRFQGDCFLNSHAKMIASMFAKGDQKIFNVTFPLFMSKYSSEPVNLANTLGGVTLDENDHIKGAKAWMLLFNLNNTTKKIPISLLRVSHFHSNTLDKELAESNTRLIPKFSVTFSLLIIFSVLCTFNTKWVHREGVTFPVVDWVLSKPVMGIVGVVVTAMAVLSAMGACLMLGITFVDMCTVMPFLSLTVGIDDTFLMLAAWHETSRSLSVEDRIEQSMRHAAVSISITSLTDALAFLIGAIAPLPAVMYFCYYSAAAISFIFLYSVTIFVAILSLQGRLESKFLHNITMQKTRNLALIEKTNCCERFFNMGSRVERQTNRSFSLERLDTRLWYQRFFEDKFARLFQLRWLQFVTILAMIAYGIGAYFGVKQLTVGFDLTNIVSPSSPARRFLEIRSELFPDDVTHLDVAVMSPPNLGNKENREAFERVIEEFEDPLCTLGRSGSDFWLFALIDYNNRLGFPIDWINLNMTAEEFTPTLESFLMSSDRYSYDILRDQNKTITAFRFSVTLRKVPFDQHIVDCAQKMRKICSKYPSYGLVSYSPLWNLADQFEIMWPQTMQDLYISIAVMVPVALLFVRQPLCALMISLNIASIAFGVLGFMSWWNINLDCTSMITIAMSVGFSVDFAAHVTFAYMTEKREIPGEENSAFCHLAGALGAVGWPVSQASISVLLGVSILATVDSYVVQTCFKTVFLVIVFGSIHALLFLPMVLYLLHSFYNYFKKLKQKRAVHIAGQDSTSNSTVSTQ
ncbi:unnamed protein product, partial [Mesorhabditis belari]|uniref:SSD domain-containing protein n=1 Tax=Mesorhabditis belari TaxID=2138241 RepID=A0AAF3EVX3_9BILA